MDQSLYNAIFFDWNKCGYFGVHQGTSFMTHTAHTHTFRQYEVNEEHEDVDCHIL